MCVCSPGYAHSDIVGQWDEGTYCNGELNLGTGKLVALVHIANDQRDNDQREEI